MEFVVNDIYVGKDGKLMKADVNVRVVGKSTRIAFFMVKCGDASDLKEILAITWDYDLERVVKEFTKKAVELNLEEFKIIDGLGYEYRVTVTLKDVTGGE